MRQKDLYKQIKESVISGKTSEQFSVKDFEFLKKSKSFISKHAVGNGKYTEYFVRVDKGLYKLK